MAISFVDGAIVNHLGVICYFERKLEMNTPQ
jgi:hypothetical protein